VREALKSVTRARARLPALQATGDTVDRAAEVDRAIFLCEPYQPPLSRPSL
jgi:hypothetical protein